MVGDASCSRFPFLLAAIALQARDVDAIVVLFELNEMVMFASFLDVDMGTCWRLPQ